jgi:SAM-dependent methyltransferase
VREAAAEDLPFPDESVDAALAQLVVHFMSDPLVGLREMRRVVRSGGVVAACVWDYAGERSPLSVFWRAAREIDPGVRDESLLAGAHEGGLRELFDTVGFRDVEEVAIEFSVQHDDFEEWWTPYTEGVGPAGSYFASLGPDEKDALRERCHTMLPDGPFTLVSRAWAAKGFVE